MGNPISGAAAMYAAMKYGGPMASSEEVKAVTNSVTSLLVNDPERVFVLIVNMGSDLIYLGYDQQVSADRGIFLAPNGGSYEVNVEDDLVIPGEALYALSVGSSTNVFIKVVRRFTTNNQAGITNETSG